MHIKFKVNVTSHYYEFLSILAIKSLPNLSSLPSIIVGKKSLTQSSQFPHRLSDNCHGIKSFCRLTCITLLSHFGCQLWSVASEFKRRRKACVYFYCSAFRNVPIFKEIHIFTYCYTLKDVKTSNHQKLSNFH